MNLESEAPAKSSSSLSVPPPSFSLLPDEITENFLARVPRSYYPKLSLVSKTFRSILSSTNIYSARSRLGSTQKCVYFRLYDWDSSGHVIFQWIALSIIPSSNKTKRKPIEQLSVQIPSSNCSMWANSMWAKPNVVGSEIYLVGGCFGKPSSSVRVLDCRSNTWRDAPNMNVARTSPATCAYDGKIYVIGGINRLLADESWAEVFDVKTQTWEFLPQLGCGIREGIFYKSTEFEGNIYLGNGDTLYAYYDPKQCNWEKKNAKFPSTECVIDNVSFSFRKHDGRYNLWWRDISGGVINEVKGLGSLRNKYRRHCGPSDTTTKTICCDGKIYVIWEGYAKKNNLDKMVMKIWCAEISVEKRDGDEIWGYVEWLDAVLRAVPSLCILAHCLAISL